MLFVSFSLGKKSVTGWGKTARAGVETGETFWYAAEEYEGDDSDGEAEVKITTSVDACATMKPYI